MTRYYLLVGRSENVRYSVNDMINRITGKLSCKPSNYLLWGFHGGYKKYEAMDVGDEIFLYATEPVKGIILYGVIREKALENDEYWPINSPKGDKWPYRIYVEVEKIASDVIENISDFSKWKNVIPHEKLRDRKIMTIRSVFPIMYDEGAKDLEGLTLDLAWISVPTKSQEKAETGLDRVIRAHLISGKNLILMGAPGIGKTRLAKRICDDFNVDYEFATANAEWTTFDLIGGLVPGKEGGEYSVGFLTRAVLRSWKSLRDKKLPTWLIIDEINRSNIDLAFGRAFTLLDIEHREDFGLLSLEHLKESGEEEVVALSQELRVPYSFRVIATMNSYDRALLFKLGFALIRRFAIVEMNSPFISSELEYEADEISLGKFSNYTDEARRNECLNEAKRQLLLVFSTNECKDYSAISEENFRKIRELVDRIESLEDLLKTIDLIVAVSSYLTRKRIVDIGYAHIVDAFKFLISYLSLGCGRPTIKDLIRGVDEAISAYIIPQLDVLGPRVRMEKIGIFGGEKELTEKIDDFHMKIGTIGPPKTLRLIEKLREEYRVF